jgi:hypothetical protein
MARTLSGIAWCEHCAMESQQNNNIGHWLRIVVAPSFLGVRIMRRRAHGTAQPCR